MTAGRVASHYQFDVLLGATEPYSGVRKTNDNQSGTAIESVTELQHDVEHTLQLWQQQEKQLKQRRLISVFHDQEMVFTSIAALLQVEGLPFNDASLGECRKIVDTKRDEITGQARELTGNPTLLLSSSAQIAHQLYTVQKLKVPKLANRGASKAQNKSHPSTNEASLLALIKATDNLLPKLILKHRHLNTLANSFVTPLTTQAVLVDPLVAESKRRIYCKWQVSPAHYCLLAAFGVQYRLTCCCDICNAFVQEPDQHVDRSVVNH